MIIIKKLESLRSRYVDFRLDQRPNLSQQDFLKWSLVKQTPNDNEHKALNAVIFKCPLGKNWNESKTGNQ